jgi:glycerophosphoryl diester phosphodiesterase
VSDLAAMSSARWLCRVVLVAALSLTGCERTVAPETKVEARAGWKIKAHRGASFDAPENTIRSVQLAIEQGAVATEIDVRLSADGVPVVFHDEDTRRIGGRARPVREQTLAELRELDVGAWRGAEFAGERIPTLQELLESLPHGFRCFVEIKDGPEAVPAVLGSIERAGKLDSVAVESFHPEVLTAVRAKQPSIPLHLGVATRNDDRRRPLPHDLAVIDRARKLGATGLAVSVQGLTPEFARAVDRAGLELGVWTINTLELAARLRDLPITWLETDRPALLRESR